MPSEPPVGAVVVVEVLPLAEPFVEQRRGVDHHPIEHPVELLFVDPVGAFDLAVQPRSARLDVDVLDPAVQDVPVKGRLEL
jgi:hypothetical protein